MPRAVLGLAQRVSSSTGPAGALSCPLGARPVPQVPVGPREPPKFRDTALDTHATCPVEKFGVAGGFPGTIQAAMNSSGRHLMRETGSPMSGTTQTRRAATRRTPVTDNTSGPVEFGSVFRPRPEQVRAHASARAGGTCAAPHACVRGGTVAGPAAWQRVCEGLQPTPALCACAGARVRDDHRAPQAHHEQRMGHAGRAGGAWVGRARTRVPLACASRWLSVRFGLLPAVPGSWVRGTVAPWAPRGSVGVNAATLPWLPW